MPEPQIIIPVWPVPINADFTPRARASRSNSSAAVILPMFISVPTKSTRLHASFRAAAEPGFSPGGSRRMSHT